MADEGIPEPNPEQVVDTVATDGTVIQNVPEQVNETVKTLEVKRDTVTDIPGEMVNAAGDGLEQQGETVPEGNAAPVPEVKVEEKKRPLTKEEKKALKLEKKKAKALKKLEKKKDVFRAHLERELHFCRLTEERALKDWIAMMAEIQLPVAQEEIQMAFQDVFRLHDKKNFIIDRLLCDLDEANAQYTDRAQRHCDLIDYYIKLFKTLVGTLRNFYQSEHYLMINDFHKETHESQVKNNGPEVFFGNLLHATNFIVSTNMEEKYKSFVLAKDQLINKSIENQFNMRDETMNSMNEIFQQMRELHDNLRQTIAVPKRISVYNKLCKKQNLSELEFAGMEAAARKSQRLIQALQKELLDNEIAKVEKLSSLKHERAYFVECYWILKNKTIADKKTDNGQMLKLAEATNVCLKFLRKVKKHGDHLIGIGAVCRKLQTEKEKVLPWPDELIGEEPNNNNCYSDDLSHLAEMELFWYKVSLAKTHNIALRKEKKRQLEDMERLKSYLEAYCHMQTNNAIMTKLGITPNPTNHVPFQESAHISQLKNRKMIKDKYKRNQNKK